jgi:hypothetical protein
MEVVYIEFPPVGPEIWKIRIEEHLELSVKYDCYN